MSHSLSARPAITPEDAVSIARECYGLDVRAHELGSTQDRNFLLTDVNGARSVLRIDNDAVTDDMRESQIAAIAAYRGAEIRTVTMLPGLDGGLVQRWRGHVTRLSKFVEGISLVECGYLAPPVLSVFGELAAASVAALAPIEHPGLERKHMWDLRAAYEETIAAAPAIADDVLRAQVITAAEAAQAKLAPLSDLLPVQAVHGDITDDNVMGTLGPDMRVYPETVFDFGDLSHGWRVAEIVVTSASMLQHELARPLRLVECAVAYHERQPLTRQEAEAFWPLVVLRSALLVASGWGQLAVDPQNDYLHERIEGKRLALLSATQLSLTELTEHLLVELGFETPNPEFQLSESSSKSPLAELFPGIEGPVVIADLGVESSTLDAGRWLENNVEPQCSEIAFEKGAAAVVLPYGSFRLTRTLINSADAGETWPVETEIRVGSGLPPTVHSPVKGIVSAATSLELVLDIGDGWRLRMTGAMPTVAAEAGVFIGDPIAQLPATGTLTIGLFREVLPQQSETGRAALVSPDIVPAWARLSADPAPLLGLPSLRELDEARTEADRREKIFARAQQRYYQQPMQIERGWREHLIDTSGRSYVDMVNNVAVAGHGHPGIADTARRQLRLLNTNSRFLYRSLAEYSERLLAKIPAGSGLDTVLLVNSGSEAVDLALRLVQAATGRQKIVTLREAYHGWTVGATAVTNNAKDNRFAFSNRPGWVHIADAPNPYRGTHRGPHSGVQYAADLGADLSSLEVAGTPIAGFICEPVLGNAGGIELPDGYLPEVYRRVRDAGGLCIADEVQVGFGRLGESFWGFELSGVLPDVITIAKAMGNGFPIGAVITSKDVADALASNGQFFSSAGGNPLSCEVGMAVLDAIETEGLQKNALELGQRFEAGIQAMAQRHAMIGVLHGAGLYRGLELVRDRETLEPATAEAIAISDRLKDLGVIMQPTSERSNVLKVKPPLCVTEETIDFVLEQIDHVLSTGW